MIRFIVWGGQNVEERGFEQRKSGGRKNMLKTIMISQVVSDECLCPRGIDLGDNPEEKITPARTWQLIKCGR